MKKRLCKAVSMLSAGAVTLSLYAPLMSGAGFSGADTSFLADENSRNNFSTSFSLSMPRFTYRTGNDMSEVVMTASYGKTGNAGAYDTAGQFPESFDLRTSGAISGVKDQGPYGTCWTHSSAASAETSVIDTDPTVDLSELHTAYFTYAGYGQKGYDPSLTAEEIIDLGGKAEDVVNLWSQWMGPIREERMPYNDLSVFESESLYELGSSADYHLLDAYLFDHERDHSNFDYVNGMIKTVLQEGYAVDASFHVNESEYYFEKYKTYYSPYPQRFANHAITIVGWDDSIPADHFMEKPAGDGAWLCRNSWGLNFGEDGFFWISYYDKSLSDLAVYILDDKDNFTTNYHHDSFTPVQAMSAFDDRETNEKSYFANIFRADTDEEVKAVSTYIVNHGSEAEVFVYTGLTDPADPTSGTLASYTTEEGLLTGYVTINLEDYAEVKAGENFGVVVSVYSEESPYVIPVETSMYVLDDETGNVVDIGGSASLSRLNSFSENGQSFYSADGKEWTDTIDDTYTYTEEEEQEILDDLKDDLYYGLDEVDPSLFQAADITVDSFKELFDSGSVQVKLGNIPLKAFTDPVGTVEFSHPSGEVPVGTGICLFAKEDQTIYYSVNNGDINVYQQEPLPEEIPVNGKVTIGAYTDNGVYKDRTYTPATAQLSSLYYNTLHYAGKYYSKQAKRINESLYEIVLEPFDNGVTLLPVASGDTVINGGAEETFHFGQWYDIESGITTFTYELKKEGALDNTVEVRVIKPPIEIDLETERLSYTTATEVYAADGTYIPDGGYVGGYAGQTVRVYADGREMEWQIPERHIVPDLEIDTYSETLGFFPNEMAEFLEFAPKAMPEEADYVSADSRLIEGSWINSGMVMNKAFSIIPGETITFRIKAGDGKFASEKAVYEIPQAPEAPEILPDYRQEDMNMIYSDFGYEYALADENYFGDFEDYAENKGYRDAEACLAAVAARLGVDKAIARVIGTGNWAPYMEIPFGREFLIRTAPTDTEFASKAVLLQVWEQGDVTKDGTVDGTDATIVLKHFGRAMHFPDPVIPEEDQYLADMNDDGVIDGTDATLILRLYGERMAKTPTAAF